MSALGPFKAKRMRITIVDALGNSYILGVVEGAAQELTREGGVVPFYDSETGKHAIGTKRATFRIRRFFKTDVGKGRLLYDLFQNEQHFNLTEELNNKAGSRITLSDCLGYTYSVITGGANDIIAEELRGEAVDWNEGLTDA
jgi:hypothetical protein